MLKIKSPRVITTYYPDSENPTGMKVLQDRSSQLRAFYFERKFLNEISEEEYATNYAVYFLLNRRPFAKTQIYIGQSKVGAKRIVNHNKNKDFWSHCIMFVTDNSVFDSNAIDYMEYFFINLLQNSKNYELQNVELRKREPNINYVDKIVYKSFLEQLIFIMKSEGIDLLSEECFFESTQEVVIPISDEEVKEEKENQEELIEINLQDKKQTSQERLYFAKGKDFSGSLEISVNSFVLKKGSIIRKPHEDMLNWSDKGALYRKLNNQGEKFLKEGYLLDNGKTYVLIKDIEFKSPSGAAEFLSGASKNGWTMFGIKRS